MTQPPEVAQIALTDGTSMQIHVSRPAGVPSRTAVVVAHELFGVNPDLQAVAEDLAAAGHLTIVPELYHRYAPAGHWLQRDDAGRAEGFALLHRLERPDAIADVAACLAWARAVPGVEAVALVGFSAGGHLAYLAACELPVAATAVLYGGWLASTAIPLSRPTPTLDLTPGITGRILFLVGGDDHLIDAAERSTIEAALTGAGIDHELVVYPGTGHAFFWPGTPAYDEQARADAWSRVLALLAGAGAG